MFSSAFFSPASTMRLLLLCLAASAVAVSSRSIEFNPLFNSAVAAATPTVRFVAADVALDSIDPQCRKGAHTEGCPENDPCCYTVTTHHKAWEKEGLAEGCRHDKTSEHSKVEASVTSHAECCEACRKENKANPTDTAKQCFHYIYFGKHMNSGVSLKKCVLLFNLHGRQIDTSGKTCHHLTHVKSAENDDKCTGLVD